jgi:hypothetical protein
MDAGSPIAERISRRSKLRKLPPLPDVFESLILIPSIQFFFVLVKAAA